MEERKKDLKKKGKKVVQKMKMGIQLNLSDDQIIEVKQTQSKKEETKKIQLISLKNPDLGQPAIILKQPEISQNSHQNNLLRQKQQQIHIRQRQEQIHIKTNVEEKYINHQAEIQLKQNQTKIENYLQTKECEIKQGSSISENQNFYKNEYNYNFNEAETKLDGELQLQNDEALITKQCEVEQLKDIEESCKRELSIFLFNNQKQSPKIELHNLKQFKQFQIQEEALSYQNTNQFEVTTIQSPEKIPAKVTSLKKIKDISKKVNKKQKKLINILSQNTEDFLNEKSENFQQKTNLNRETQAFSPKNKQIKIESNEKESQKLQMENTEILVGSDEQIEIKQVENILAEKIVNVEVKQNLLDENINQFENNVSLSQEEKAQNLKLSVLKSQNQDQLQQKTVHEMDYNNNLTKELEFNQIMKIQEKKQFSGLKYEEKLDSTSLYSEFQLIKQTLLSEQSSNLNNIYEDNRNQLENNRNQLKNQIIDDKKMPKSVKKGSKSKIVKKIETQKLELEINLMEEQITCEKIEQQKIYQPESKILPMKTQEKSEEQVYKKTEIDNTIINQDHTNSQNCQNELFSNCHAQNGLNENLVLHEKEYENKQQENKLSGIQLKCEEKNQQTQKKLRFEEIQVQQQEEMLNVIKSNTKKIQKISKKNTTKAKKSDIKIKSFINSQINQIQQQIQEASKFQETQEKIESNKTTTIKNEQQKVAVNLVEQHQNSVQSQNQVNIQHQDQFKIIESIDPNNVLNYQGNQNSKIINNNYQLELPQQISLTIEEKLQKKINDQKNEIVQQQMQNDFFSDQIKHSNNQKIEFKPKNNKKQSKISKTSKKSKNIIDFSVNTSEIIQINQLNEAMNRNQKIESTHLSIQHDQEINQLPKIENLEKISCFQNLQELSQNYKIVAKNKLQEVSEIEKIVDSQKKEKEKEKLNQKQISIEIKQKQSFLTDVFENVEKHQFSTVFEQKKNPKKEVKKEAKSKAKKVNKINLDSMVMNMEEQRQCIQQQVRQNEIDINRQKMKFPSFEQEQMLEAVQNQPILKQQKEKEKEKVVIKQRNIHVEEIILNKSEKTEMAFKKSDQGEKQNLKSKQMFRQLIVMIEMHNNKEIELMKNRMNDLERQLKSKIENKEKQKQIRAKAAGTEIFDEIPLNRGNSILNQAYEDIIEQNIALHQDTMVDQAML